MRCTLNPPHLVRGIGGKVEIGPVTWALRLAHHFLPLIPGRNIFEVIYLRINGQPFAVHQLEGKDRGKAQW